MDSTMATTGAEATIPAKTLRQRLRASSLALLTANLMPLLGVLALNWDVTPIMVFYWSENLVVGFYNVLKMRRAQGSVASSSTTLNDRPVQQSDRRAMIVFFIVHYGMFTPGPRPRAPRFTPWWCWSA
ncbi:MAG: DUF6498-containing protein [Candidatus Aminicenantes bacterium]|nr:DUF6498-containing protein [Candidatus Aminicenantes bacterium]